MRGTTTPLRPVPGLYDERRVGRRIKNARQDRGQSVEELAEAISRLTGELMTPQMIRNMESGRKRIDAALLPVLSYVQQKSFAYYLLDDPSGYDSRQAGLAQSNVVPLRKWGDRPTYQIVATPAAA